MKKLFILLMSVFLLLVSLVACQAEEPVNAPALETETEPTAALEATEITENEPAVSPTATEEAAADFAEEATATAEPTTVPEPTPTLRSIEASGPISDPGSLLGDYMSEGLFLSHFDAADVDLWYSYSQDSETTIINADVAPPDGYISSSTWHAKQTDKWVLPTDDLNLQTDQVIAGDGAAVWSDTVLSTRLTIVDIPHDWSEHSFLSFWAYSEVANDAGIQIAIYSELDSTSSDDYYKKEVIIDWVGWRLFEIPLHEFRATRDPVGWHKIDYIKIASSGWGHTPAESTKLIFDEMKLSNIRLGPQLSIDLPSDLEHPHLFLDSAELEEIKRKAETYDWAERSYATLQVTADNFLKTSLDIPTTGGGFYHNDDAAAYEITARHYELADRARDLGLMYQFTGDPVYLAGAREILLGYSDLYLTYELQDKEGRTGDQASAGGRATAQAINEARWIIPLAWAYDLVHNDLAPEELETIADQLLRPAADLIMLNNEGRHNHQSWYNSAVGIIGFLLEEKEYVWYALLKDDSSLAYQLDKSVTADGMWYEGSMHYQFYVLRAMLPLMEATHHAGFDVYQDPKYKGLFDFMITYADPYYQMPTLNDGRMVDLLDSDRVTFYEIAYARLGDPRYAALLEESPRDDVNALLYGVAELGEAVDPVWETQNYAESDLAVLRSGGGETGKQPIQATLNYMGYAGGHSHADQLGLVMYALGQPLTVDPSSVKYRLPEQVGWFKQTLAHNGLVVDGVSQERAPAAELRQFVTAGSVQLATVYSADLYPGVEQERTLILNDDYLIDFYSVSSPDPHVYDWVIHNRGRFSSEDVTFVDSAIEPIEPSEPSLIESAYPYLKNVQEAESTEDVHAQWRVASLVQLHVDLLASPDGATTYFAATGPIATVTKDEIAEEQIPLLIARREMTQTQFVSLIQPVSNEDELLELTPVTLNGEDGQPLETADGRALQITRSDSVDLLILGSNESIMSTDDIQFNGKWGLISEQDDLLKWLIVEGSDTAGDGWRVSQEDLSAEKVPPGMGLYLEVIEPGYILVENLFEYVSFITMEGFMESAVGILEVDDDGNLKRIMPIKVNEDGVVKFLAQPGESYIVLSEAHADDERLEE